MHNFALAALQTRSRQLRQMLETGQPGQVTAARENLRLSLVELHHLGYWRERPELFRDYMRLFRSCRCLDVSAPPSKSVPDKMARYSP